LNWNRFDINLRRNYFEIDFFCYILTQQPMSMLNVDAESINRLALHGIDYILKGEGNIV